VLWETLTARRLFDGEHAGIIFSMVMNGEIEPPSRVVPGIPPELDDVVLRGLARDPDKRYPTALAMAMDLEDRVGVASPRQVSEWLAQVAGDALSKRAMRVQEIESLSTPAPVLMLESLESISAAAGALHAHGLGSPPAAAPPSPPAPNLTGTFGPLPSARAPQPPAGWQPDVAPSSGLSSRSQVSSVSVASSAMPSPAPSTSRGRLIAFAGGAAAAVAVAAVIVFLFGGEPSAGSAAPQTAPTGTPSVIAPEPTAAAATADPIVPAVAPAPSASSAAPSSTHESGPAPGAPDASASSPSVASPAGQPSRPPPVKPVATGKPPAACYPPYTIDAKGIRRPKPQCL
jgi:serine/threonine-protein kinase